MRAPNTTRFLLSAVAAVFYTSILLPLHVISLPVAPLAQLEHPFIEKNRPFPTRRLRSATERDTNAVQASQSPSFPGDPHNKHDDDQSHDSAPAGDVIKNYRPQTEHKLPVFAKLKQPSRKTSRVTMYAESKQTIKSNMRSPRAERDDSRVPRISIFSVIHPVLAAALTPDKPALPKLPLKGPISRVEYKSSPLRGTESRDREALGLSAESAPLPFASSQQSLNPREFEQIWDQNQRQASEISSAHGQQSFMDNGEAPHNKYRTVSSSTSASPQLSPPVPKQNEYTSYERVRHFETDLSPQQENTKPSRSTNINRQVSALQNSSRKFWSSVIDNIRQTIEKLKAPAEARLPPLRGADTRHKIQKDDGYTEKDLDMMINDIMREIQMRSEDAEAYRKMLKDNNRWSANDDIGSGPLMLQSRLLVDPKIVAEALAHSAKKLVLSKYPQPSRETTIELLRAVQIKLAELLQKTD